MSLGDIFKVLELYPLSINNRSLEPYILHASLNQSQKLAPTARACGVQLRVDRLSGNIRVGPPSAPYASRDKEMAAPACLYVGDIRKGFNVMLLLRGSLLIGSVTPIGG